MRDQVTASYNEGVGAGIQGTPHSFIIIGNQQAPIEGAQPYEVVKQIVENLLGQLEGNTPSN
jgi:predicted DsbA family dithiol-disulfide isomerase